MNRLKVGYASADITPPLGVAISGYFVPRYVKGILDGLEVSALSLACDEQCVIWITVDNCKVEKCVVDRIADEVAAALSIDALGLR